MSRVKFDFLNWQPDQEDYKNEGLITAENVLHSEEGFIPYKTPAFATNTALGTCPSLVVKSVGTNNQRVVAYLTGGTAAGAGYIANLNIGLFSSGYTTVADYTSIASSTISNAYTGNRVTAFDVCELGGVIFMTAQAELPTSTVLNVAEAPLVTLNATGYATI